MPIHSAVTRRTIISSEPDEREVVSASSEREILSSSMVKGMKGDAGPSGVSAPVTSLQIIHMVWN